MPKMVNDKYRIQVSITEKDYQLLRRMAYELEMTVNELIVRISVRAAEDFIKDGM